MTSGSSSSSSNTNHNPTMHDHVDYASLGRRLRKAKRRLLFEHLLNVSQELGKNNSQVDKTIVDAKMTERATTIASSRESSPGIPVHHLASLLRDASTLHRPRARK